MTETDPTRPPDPEAVDLGHGVWASWNATWAREGRPAVWHWCSRSVIRRTQTDRQAWWYEPRWVVAGTGAHDLISRDPLTLSPSLALPECCGLHGYVEAGAWRPC